LLERFVTYYIGVAKHSEVRSLLSVRGHPDLLADVENRARAALWAVAGANMFAKGDKQTIELDPKLARQVSVKLRHCFFGTRGVDVTPAVGDAVDVNVDADAWPTASDAQDQVGTFWSDAAKGEKCFFVAREVAVEIVDHSPGDPVNLFGFGFVEGAVVDQAIDLSWPEFGHVLRSPRRREQIERGWNGDFVPGANRDDAGDDLLERRGMASGGQVE
jgi:hypothetical protein